MRPRPRSTSSSPRPAPRSGRSGGRTRGSARWHACSASRRSSRSWRTHGIAAGAPTKRRSSGTPRNPRSARAARTAPCRDGCRWPRRVTLLLVARQRRPAIVAVDDEPAVLAAVARDLRRGFGERYRILRAGSGNEALNLLKALRTHGDQVALLVADQKMPGLSGTEYLVEARKVVPDAKRVLLTAYADTEAAISAINEVALD